MKQTVTLNNFRDAFRARERMDNFGHEGLEVLFNYLEQYEADTGEEMELDVIALCCDYNMMDWREIARDYSVDIEGMDEDEAMEAVSGYIQQNTSYVGSVGDEIIFQAF